METQPLYPELTGPAPPTEGIKYAGSKLRLLPHILQIVKKVDAKTILDGFSGTTRVSQALARSGYRVLCNDIAAWSEIFGICYLLNKRKKDIYADLIGHLNAVKPRDGWFTDHYGGNANGGCSIQEDGLKKPWQRHNTRKLDAIREEIDVLHLSNVEKAVALTSLILAMDRVDNSMGHFASYLHTWSPRSYHEMQLTVPHVFDHAAEHQVFRRDIFELLPDAPVDLAYFDPPYGSNNKKMPPSRVRYASYYHLWTTICLYDRPNIIGKAKRREDASDRTACSVFEDFRRNEREQFIAVEAIARLLENTRARWIVLSYSSGGRATAEELNLVLKKHGTPRAVMEIDYRKNVMAGMKWTHEWIRDSEQPHREFLFLLDKNG